MLNLLSQLHQHGSCVGKLLLICWKGLIFAPPGVKRAPPTLCARRPLFICWAVCLYISRFFLFLLFFSLSIFFHLCKVVGHICIFFSFLAEHTSIMIFTQSFYFERAWPCSWSDIKLQRHGYKTHFFRHRRGKSWYQSLCWHTENCGYKWGFWDCYMLCSDINWVYVSATVQWSLPGKFGLQLGFLINPGIFYF